MAERYLVITEVSQKQAYIFRRNELQINVSNSAAIAWITSPDYFKRAAGGAFSEKQNLVYAGGGHSVLQFESEKAAKEFCRKLSLKAHKEFPDMEVFTKVAKYDEHLDLDERGRVVAFDPENAPNDPKVNAANIRHLIEELEKKKSVRQSTFHQGTFGIEKLDSTDFAPVPFYTKEEEKAKDNLQYIVWKSAKEEDQRVLPDGFEMPGKFEDLGGSKGESNFIAVIHIDGNGMGNRVLDFQKSLPGAPEKWDEFREKLSVFSKKIDADFKEAFLEMNKAIAFNLEKKDPDKKERRNRKLEQLTLVDGILPVRRIITSGDDICFVTEGRIGIEAAAIFLEKLAAIKGGDGKPYGACAGVVIVHSHFPFYRAYDLAEQLCGHAKSVNAEIAGSRATEISSIDWHLEFGEMQDRLKDIRKEYETMDGRQLELRPYIVCEPNPEASYEPNRQYGKFKKVEQMLQDRGEDFPSGKIKELRGVLKQGEAKTRHYLDFGHMSGLTMESYEGIFTELTTEMIGTGKGLAHKTFISVKGDNKEHAILFDAIELMDTFIPLER